MTKPILDVTITTHDEKEANVKAVFDTGSFYTILREDCLPQGGAAFRFESPRQLPTAGRTGGVNITGQTIIIITIGEKMILTRTYISPDLRREMLIGAETMQSWDITIENTNGKTQIRVGHDMRDPEITEVD